MSMDAILKRADELLHTIQNAGEDSAQISEAFSGTLNLLGIVHGPGSIQERQLVQAMGTADKTKEFTRNHNLRRLVTPAVQGTLKS